MASYLIPAAEVGAAVLLVLPPTTRIGAAAACTLAVGFTGVVALDSRSVIANCGCWGVTSSDIPKTYYLVRSVFLLGAALAILLIPLLHTVAPSWRFDLVVAAFGLTAPLALFLLELPQIGQIIYVQRLGYSSGDAVA